MGEGRHTLVVSLFIESQICLNSFQIVRRPIGNHMESSPEKREQIVRRLFTKETLCSGSLFSLLLFLCLLIIYIIDESQFTVIFAKTGMMHICQ